MPPKPKIEHKISPWKSVETGRTDYVLASSPKSSDYDQGAVGFKSGYGPVAAMPTTGEGKKKLSITGKSGGTEEEIVAWYSMKDTAGNTAEEEMGKIKVATYDKSIQKLVIVPVNDVKYPISQGSLQTRLNLVYNQAVVNWEVTFNDKLTVNYSDGNNTFQDGGTGLVSNYTGEMDEVIAAYWDAFSRDKSTYYLFLIGNSPEGGKTGFMPLKRQWGFIFTSKLNNEDDYVWAIAHELGHGAFRLYHTFSNNNNYKVTVATDNLMDYNKGRFLHKYQWDYIHDPQSMLALFQEEGEGAAEFKEGLNVILTLTDPIFAPGNNDLKISYEFQYIPQEKDDKKIKPSILPLIVDIKLNNDEIIYISDKLTKGEFNWNGTMTKGTKKDSRITTKEGEFKVCFSNFETGDETDSKKIEQKIYKEITAKVDEDWGKFQSFIFKDKISYGTDQNGFLKYKNCKPLYENIIPVGKDPIDYLNDILTEGKFLGKTIIVNKKFYCVLQDIEKDLKEKGLYDKYSKSFDSIDDFMRMSTVGGGLSNHANGFALDIDKKKNPCFKDDNKTFDLFIDMVTGKYLYGGGVKLDDIWDAGRLFKNRILDNGITIDNIIAWMYNISEYHNNKNFSAINLRTIKNKDNEITNELIQILTDYYNNVEIKEGEKEPLDKISLLLASVNGLKDILDDYNSIMFISEKNLDGKEDADAYQDMVNYLSKIYDIIEKYKILLTNNTSGEVPDYSTEIDKVNFGETAKANVEIDRIYKKLETISSSYSSLDKFADKLNSDLNNAGDETGKHLFTYGFINVNNGDFKDFIKYMNDNKYITWGGTFGKKDYMHFAIKSNQQADLKDCDK